MNLAVEKSQIVAHFTLPPKKPLPNCVFTNRKTNIFKQEVNTIT